MFLNLLTPEQQTLYLQAARSLLSEVVSSEEALLEAARAECAVDEMPPDVEFQELVDRAPAVLDSPAARNAFLLELAGAMVIDGETAVTEMQMLERLGSTLDVGKASLREFVSFAERARDLVADGQRLIATEATA